MISELTQLAIKAAIEASKEILTIYQSDDFKIEKKKRQLSFNKSW